MKRFNSSILLLLFVSVFISCNKKDEDPSPCGMDTPIVFLGNDTTVSNGESIILDAGNSGSSYLWSNDEVSQTITVNTSGVYWVRATNCAGSDSDTIAIEPCDESFPIVYLGNDTVLNMGESLTLDAGNPGSLFLWSNGEISQNITVNSSGTYWVTVSNCAGSSSDTIDVEFCDANIPIVDLGDDKTLFEGQSVTLYAGNPGSSYLWSTGAETQTITVDTSGVFWVNISNCAGSATDTLVVELAYKTVIIKTDFGNFRIWLCPQTYLHRDNFISLTENNFYDNLIFHRVDFNFVIQGGDPLGTGYGGPGYTIPAEIIPGLNHDYGAVGAARMPDNVNPDRESNGSQFYIVSDPNGEPILNGDYTVFGYVFDGIENVYEISEVPVDANDRPITDVFMNSVIIDYLTATKLLEDYGFVIP